MHGPPRYLTVDWDAAGRSVATLAQLEPELALTGHGRPLRGPGLRQALHDLDRGFASVAVPETGRYVEAPIRAGDPAATQKP